MTRIRVPKAELRRWYGELPASVRDEMAIPSYLHWNPLIPWVVKRRIRLALDLAAPRTGEALLDFGCGTGVLLLQLPVGGTYFGTDLITEPARHILAASGRTDIEVLESGEWANTIRDGSVDCIMAIEVLEHVEDVAAICELFRRKLSRRGRIVISGPTENMLYRVARWVAGFSGDYHRRDVSEIFKIAEASGLVVTRERVIPFGGPGALFRLARFENRAETGEGA